MTQIEQYDRLTMASAPRHGSPENDHTELIYSSFVLHDTGLCPLNEYPSIQPDQVCGLLRRFYASSFIIINPQQKFLNKATRHKLPFASRSW